LLSLLFGHDLCNVTCTVCRGLAIRVCSNLGLVTTSVLRNTLVARFHVFDERYWLWKVLRLLFRHVPQHLESDLKFKSRGACSYPCQHVAMAGLDCSDTQALVKALSVRCTVVAPVVLHGCAQLLPDSFACNSSRECGRGAWRHRGFHAWCHESSSLSYAGISC
jgi:hypothetical protein